MGRLSRRERRAQEKTAEEISKQKLVDFIKGSDVDDNVGINVSEETALKTSAVYACVKVIAESIASLPLHLIREDKGVKTRARGHPLFGVLHDLANEETTSLNFREAMLASLLLWGNAYARIEREKGHVTALWFLKPQRMEVERDKRSGKIVYRYNTEDAGQAVEFGPREIFHVIGFSMDGLKGLSPIQYAKQTIGLSMATEEFGAKFFSNGARPGGILEAPGVVEDPDRLKEAWNAQFQGGRNSHRVAVMEEGVKYRTIGIPPDEAQFLETRKFQLSEICRIFRVPPHMIADLDRATFSNIEHQSIEFVQHTLRPWIVRFEQAVYKCLLSPEERHLYYARFNVDGLLRGDYQTRMQGYAVGIQNGFLSPNCVRELEELDPIPDEKGGNNFMVNGNMKLLTDTELKPDAAPPEPIPIKQTAPAMNLPPGDNNPKLKKIKKNIPSKEDND